MTKYRTAELRDGLLDLAVGMIERQDCWVIGDTFTTCLRRTLPGSPESCEAYKPSTDWCDGGPIIEREGIEIFPDSMSDDKDPKPGIWFATAWRSFEGVGASPLVAAMRAYVTSELGDEVDL